MILIGFFATTLTVTSSLYRSETMLSTIYVDVNCVMITIPVNYDGDRCIAQIQVPDSIQSNTSISSTSISAITRNENVTGIISFHSSNSSLVFTSQSCSISNGTSCYVYVNATLGSEGVYSVNATYKGNLDPTGTNEFSPLYNLTIVPRATTINATCVTMTITVNVPDLCKIEVTDFGLGQEIPASGTLFFSDEEHEFVQNTTVISGNSTLNVQIPESLPYGDSLVILFNSTDPNINESEAKVLFPVIPRLSDLTDNCNSNFSIPVDEQIRCSVTVIDGTQNGTKITPNGHFSIYAEDPNNVTNVIQSSCEESLNLTCTFFISFSSGEEGHQILNVSYFGDPSHARNSSQIDLLATLRDSSVSLNCTRILNATGQFNCTAFVSDSSPMTKLVPNSTVMFGLVGNSQGIFSPTACSLIRFNSSLATCSVVYASPSNSNSSEQELVATYNGNTDHSHNASNPLFLATSKESSSSNGTVISSASINSGSPPLKYGATLIALVIILIVGLVTALFGLRRKGSRVSVTESGQIEEWDLL